jgi:poly [ADP-ribose] polymerase
VAVPCGKGIKHLAETELLYNEFIVYDADQLRIRYLLKVRFDFKKK